METERKGSLSDIYLILCNQEEQQGIWEQKRGANSTNHALNFPPRLGPQYTKAMDFYIGFWSSRMIRFRNPDQNLGF